MSPELAFLLGVAVGTLLTRVLIDVKHWLRARREQAMSKGAEW